MAQFKYKYQMYKNLQANIPNIYADTKKASEDIVPAAMRGKFGLTGAISGCPAPLREDILAATEKGSHVVIPLAVLVDEIREIVKDVYGDEWDAAPISTCEGALWVTYDCLFTPPALGRGDNYRARYIIPLEKHLHHQGGYGRPFPPRYKDILADRGSTAGELGFYGKRQNNLDTVMVPLEGAKYDCHGIKYWPVYLLTEVDPKKSIDRLARHAEIHGAFLTGFASLAYTTPGYGYGAKDETGEPLLSRYIADLAHSYDVPYVVDNAWGLPFVGYNPTKTGADIICYAMDKATGSPTSGLIIGKEDLMVPIRRAMGMHGDRYGTTASYGKAAYVGFDPGKEAMLGQIQALKVLRDNPQVLTKPVDDLYEVVTEEFGKINSKIKDGFIFTKSYNGTAVEVNYEGTWKKGGLGVPIFSIEDMYSGTNIFQVGMSSMGVIPTVAYDGNIYISTGLGTTDSKGNLDKETMRVGVRCLVQLIEITCKYAGLI